MKPADWLVNLALIVALLRYVPTNAEASIWTGTFVVILVLFNYFRGRRSR